MELFIQVYFWFAVVFVASRAIVLGSAEYPRRVIPFTIGQDLFVLLCRAGFGLWAAYLLWG